jgi:hypothetical protein
MKAPARNLRPLMLFALGEIISTILIIRHFV